MRNWSFLAGFAVLVSAEISGAYAQEASEQGIADLEAKYTEVYEANREILDNGQSSEGSKCAVGATFDAEWGLTSIKFDVPEVTFKLQEIKFHFLKTYSSMREFSFDVPEFVWGTTEVGPVKLDLPKIYSKRIEIKTKIPEFEWDVTSIKTKIPEFKSRRIEWKFHILKIGKLKEVHTECEQYRNEFDSFAASADSIKGAAESLGAEAQEAAMAKLVSASNELSQILATSESDYLSAMSSIDQSMIEMIEMGADLTMVKTVIDDVEVPISEAKGLLTSRHLELLEVVRAEQEKVLKAIQEVSSSSL